MDPITFYYFCRTFMVLAFILGVLDAVSTGAALAYGGREANPIWRWVIGIIGPYWIIPRIGFALGIVWVNVGTATAPFVWYAIPGAVLPVLLLLYVVVSNFRIAIRLRRLARSEYR